MALLRASQTREAARHWLAMRNNPAHRTDKQRVNLRNARRNAPTID